MHSVHTTPLTHSHRGLGVPGSDGSGQNQQLPEDVGQGICRERGKGVGSVRWRPDTHRSMVAPAARCLLESQARASIFRS